MKRRFLISNIKHSTRVFELALPDFVIVTCFASIISNLGQFIDCSSSLGDMNSPVDYSYLSLEIKKRSVLTRAIKYKSEACLGNRFSLSLKKSEVHQLVT
ncbi:TPA: hypothetical protein ACGPBF_001546 [Streptococcus suis]